MHAFHAMHREVVGAGLARQRLTADIAHDLGTPLTVMQGTLEGLLDGTFQPTPARLERLHTETLHMAQLVADLRLLALAEAGELHLNLETLRALEVLDSVAGAFASAAEAAGVTLAAHAAPGLSLRADPLRLSQVLRNLVANALAHTPPGGTVSLAAEEDGAGLRFDVTDSGSGIAPADLPHVFERLYRADAARHGGGSGLGLSIARSVVEAHKGRIWLSSEAGQGTQVSFWLPLGPTGGLQVLGPPA
ncbi:sensor histidine kinase [Deinococcus lacus]|uniref:histidine kinase n=1 Tax=Deinococcus lacus TaxID=392561 RepID=A0ABW1YHR6_9DEIO